MVQCDSNFAFPVALVLNVGFDTYRPLFQSSRVVAVATFALNPNHITVLSRVVRWGRVGSVWDRFAYCRYEERFSRSTGTEKYSLVPLFSSTLK